MLRRVEFMLEKANNVKLDFIVLSRTQPYLAHPFYYNSNAYKYILKSIPLFIFRPRHGTLNINHTSGFAASRVQSDDRCSHAFGAR